MPGGGFGDNLLRLRGLRILTLRRPPRLAGDQRGDKIRNSRAHAAEVGGRGARTGQGGGEGAGEATGQRAQKQQGRVEKAWGE